MIRRQSVEDTRSNRKDGGNTLFFANRNSNALRCECANNEACLVKEAISIRRFVTERQPEEVALRLRDVPP